MSDPDHTIHSAAVQDAPPALTGQFFSLMPDRVLDAVEQAGHRTTGLCYPLNSLENRVYEVELEDGERLIGKFYRPGRWSRETILDEHQILQALIDEEIPAVAAQPFPDGETLHTTDDGIFFALFPKRGGRSPDELNLDECRELGRLLARIHNVASKHGAPHRPTISPATYGTEALEIILAKAELPTGLKQSYCDAVKRIVDVGEARFSGVEMIPVHGDCHKGNLLRGPDGFFFLDFDDMGIGPAAQDSWLLLPGRRSNSQPEIEAFLDGYEIFRAIDRTSMRLIEVLRALRYVRYAAWIASRWDDPSFPRVFPYWGTENYWQSQLTDLHDQLRVLQEEEVTHVAWE